MTVMVVEFIGYWDNGDNGSKWQFVKVLPIITNDAGNFTISFLPAISGQQIYYTTDNSDPRTSSTGHLYSGAFQLTGSDTKVKACVELNNHYSEVVIYNTVPCATPVITNTDGVIDMTCATPGASIYYTTDGSTPTPSSTLFETSFNLPITTSVEQIRAIAVSDPDFSDISEEASLNINKCNTPSITVNTTNGEVTMTSTSGAIIRYTTNGSNPNTGSTQYSFPNALLPDGNTTEQIKAIAYKAGMRPSDIKTYYVPQCDLPVITNNDGTITITCGLSNAHIHYATSVNGSFSDYTAPFQLGSALMVRAYASHAGYRNSSEALFWGVLTEVSSTDEITDMGGGYKLAAGFTVNGSIGSADHPFTGVIDGQFNTIASTSSALVAYADGAIIKNVIIGNATVNGTGDVGAICNTATGNAKIYNCGVLQGSVSGTNYVGSLVCRLARRFGASHQLL
ncbi:MAG: chitobiase/beta-hexosaminidase C-terminal domain-containing protein [Bacteroidales bacterium]|nr:chitobiase/beta-hexosaminidase C-terminal domain-containing protein [Bacteroidales bacterium]